jgi:hypothetical protein
MVRRLASGLALAGLALPGVAAAHAAERALIMLLPTGYYLAGGAAAVAVSFAVLAAAPRGLGGFRRRLRLKLPLPPMAGTVRWLAFAAFAALLAIGFWGPRDPLENLLVLTLWTLWWVGFTLLTAVVGDFWPLLNPWSAPVALARRLVGSPPLRPPRRGGRVPGRRAGYGPSYWPALIGLFAFVWFEIVDPAPADPARLARAAAVYWLAHFAAMLLFGERRWRARGETFSVLFRFVGRVAPLQWNRRGVTLSWPGARLARGPALPLSGWLFVTAVIASVSFDGLSATFAWLAAIGINPLEFPGRSAVLPENTLGLLAAWAALAGAYAGTVTLGHGLAGSRAGLAETLGRIGLSLVPIALAYHFAHYLTALMLDGQNAYAAIGDLSGLWHYHASASFLNHLPAVEAIWRVQTAAIVGGHVLAVAVAHATALESERDPRRAALGQLPLALLMVGLTLFGLWLLSTPTGA